MRLIDADAMKADLLTVDPQYETMIHWCLTVLDAQPTIEERKTGKWIAVDDAYNRISGKCSACGWEAHLYEDDVVGMDYCPNCGADMRGEQDE